MISVDQAFELIQKNVRQLREQSVPLEESVGRLLARPICADVDSPPHDKSVMDGFAVRSADITDQNGELKVIETVIAGDWPQLDLQPGQATRIMTGAPLPKGADAVVMIEQTATRSDERDDWVTIELDEVPAGKHRMLRADNFASGDTIFSAGHRIRPVDIGLLAEIGAASVPTFEQPTVAVLPTGNELVGCEHTPDRGQLRNSNGPMLIAMAQQQRACVTDLGIGRDDPQQLSQLIEQGLDHDVLILTGGVSAGMMDLVPGLLASHGVEQVFHKVKMKPGKPVWFGVLNAGSGESGKQTVVFGLPGNPVSSLVGFHLFVRAAMVQLTGGVASEPPSLRGILSADHQTRGDRPTYWPGAVVTDSETKRQFQPLAWNGSSDLRALGQADGLIFFPAPSDGTGSHHHQAGEEVTFFPLT